MLNNNSLNTGPYLIQRLLLFVCMPFTIVSAQHYTTQDFDQHLKSIDSIYVIKLKYQITGLVLKTEADEDFTGAKVVSGNDTLELTPEEQHDASELSTFSNLINFSPPINEFLFYPGNIDSPITFYFIDAQTGKKTSANQMKKKSAGCSEPVMIEQSEWRYGLQDPSYERVPNEVHNIIIHHSAGSNSDTDFINVIRNIYIYHTEIRFWSDIGYNYVIAQDGTIFKARDPGLLEQDAVLGAHFCNSNTGTLGICVLGTYTAVTPTQQSISSLQDLITWKLGKDSLDPLGSFPHSLNMNLDVISGHRDGCATECPGDSLYHSLISLRQQVMDSFQYCGYAVEPVSLEGYKTGHVKIRYGTGEIIFDIDTQLTQLVFYDIYGRRYYPETINIGPESYSISTLGLPVGIYFAVFLTEYEKQVFKVAVY
jgi:hypothetical protein